MPGEEQDRSVGTESSKPIFIGKELGWNIFVQWVGPIIIRKSMNTFEVSFEAQGR